MIFSQPKDVVLKVAERIFDNISNYHSDLFGHIGVSIGVAIYPDDNKDLREVIKLADEHLYKAKKNGRNRVISDLDKS